MPRRGVRLGMPFAVECKFTTMASCCMYETLYPLRLDAPRVRRKQTACKKIATKRGWGQNTHHTPRSELLFLEYGQLNCPATAPGGGAATGTTVAQHRDRPKKKKKKAHHSAVAPPGSTVKRVPAGCPRAQQRSNTHGGDEKSHHALPASHRLSWLSAGYKRRPMEHRLRKKS